MNKATKLFFGFVFVGAIALVFTGVEVGGQRQPVPDTSALDKDFKLRPELAAEQNAAKARQDAAKAKKEAAFQEVVTTMLLIRQSARNPDSVVWERVLASDDAELVCVQLRAQNGFGGFSRENVTAYRRVISTKPAEWNKRCANKALTDFSYARSALPK